MRKIKYIDIGVEKIDKIYHIADVHIRNLKRHKEYREVFSQLYGYILSTMGKNDVIYIAGDIVHAKTDMSPEVVDLTQEFFCKLADLLPTIVIPGNHDANLNNKDKVSQLIPKIRKNFKDKAKITPRYVATPFPPLNFNQTGNM